LVAVWPQFFRRWLPSWFQINFVIPRLMIRQCSHVLWILKQSLIFPILHRYNVIDGDLVDLWRTFLVRVSWLLL